MDSHLSKGRIFLLIGLRIQALDDDWMSEQGEALKPGSENNSS